MTHRKLSATIGGAPSRALTTLLLTMLALVTSHVQATPPDLTAGGFRNNDHHINLGATGMRGWVYHVNQGDRAADTSESRQIQVRVVDAGSPADGVLAIQDVILGADGTGGEPVPFSSDARKSLAHAIADAEARSPATLRLLRWRSETTTTVEITLRTMGAYASTAPYHCVKSTQILAEGAQWVSNNETSGLYSFGALSLLATGNPDYAARVRDEARALVPDAATRAQMMSDQRDATSMVTWERGHTLVFLAEYYLATGDAEVFPAVEAYAVNIAKNTSVFGTIGHIFAEQNRDGSPNGPMGGVYGPVNSIGMTAYLGMLLARECGLTNPEIQPAIDRSSRFFASYAGRGAIPYGEHQPEPSHEGNGRSGLAALCFALEDHRAEAGRFYTKMATAGASEREHGHTGPFFNFLWGPLGAAVGGEAAAAEHFSRISWHLDLARRWNGAFVYDNLNGEGRHSGATYYDFRMSTPALLVYALPLRHLHITGRAPDTDHWLTSEEIQAAAAADDYHPVARTISQLIADTGNWSPKVRRRAAIELKARNISSAERNQLHTIAMDANLPAHARAGASDALGRIANADSVTVLADLLNDSENQVRHAAAEALRYLPDAVRRTVLNQILVAAAENAKPWYPVADEDPLQFANGRLAVLLFYGGTFYGPRGILWDDLSGVDRDLLYPAIRAAAASPLGFTRNNLQWVYPMLTEHEMREVSGAVVDTVIEFAPSDRMFAFGVRQSGADMLEKFHIAEGVPAGLRYMIETRAGDRSAALGTLERYAASYTTVNPVPDVVGEVTPYLTTIDGNTSQRREVRAAAQAVLDAIAADTNPRQLEPLKGITSIIADAPGISLPAHTTVLRVSAYDHAQGDSIFTWRKVRGAGEVTFTPNGTAESKDTVIGFDGVPGQYLFEVTMSDSRGLTEVDGTVAVTLSNPDGSLPPNDPPVAHSRTISTIPGESTPITLTGSDPEGYALGFAVTSQPAHGTLSGTPPNLTYTSRNTYLGPDSFTFQAIDSEGKTDTATLSINVSNVGIQLLVHEPFDYPAGALNGLNSTSDVGFAGPWHAHADSRVASGGLSYGDLAVSGRSVGNLAGGINRYGASRTISTSALAENGLLDDGATLWFSAIIGYGSGGNVANARLAIALANNNFSGGNNQYYILNEGSQPGSGLGLTLGRFESTNGMIVATQFRDASHGTSASSGNVFGNSGVGSLGSGQHRLVVGKMIWGAESDTIELYLPDQNFDLHAPVSKLTVNVDQSTFDTITWARGDVVTMDEIRFGSSLAAVIGIEGAPPGAPFADWGDDFPGLTNPDPVLDFDGGGLATALEWVLGGNPTDPSDDATILPTLDATSDPDGKLRFTFRRSAEAAADENTTIIVEYGSDLTGWSAAAHEGTGPDDITISEQANGFAQGIDRVTVALPPDLTTTGKLFVRLSVDVQE